MSNQFARKADLNPSVIGRMREDAGMISERELGELMGKSKQYARRVYKSAEDNAIAKLVATGLSKFEAWQCFVNWIQEERNK